jgi:hypothetical protein
LQYLADPFWWTPAQPHPNQGTNHVAHLMMQKGIGAKLKLYAGTVTPNFYASQVTYWRSGLAFCGTESREILFANEPARGFIHQRHIQIAMHPADSAGQQGRTDRLIQQHITVGAFKSAKASVKIRRHNFRPKHRHPGRQTRIRAENPSMFRPEIQHIEMHDLSDCMHTGIGSPSGHSLHWRGMDMAQSAFEMIL